MQPRSRIRGRDPPPPPSGGGRYRRRSPPPPSPRYQRRARDPPPPQPQRRSPEKPPPPRRYEESPLPDTAADRRARADILLEAGRLAAHYLVAQGVLPEHILRAKEDPNHNPSPRPELHAPASYGRKRDDDDDPRCRWSGGGTGDWVRGKGDDDRQARRSGWDRRSHSFDERRKYNDGGGADADRIARRSRDYDEPKRPPMSRSFSQNDRRPSGDGRVDRRRRSRSRSRSRSRTRTRSRRDSDCRAGSRDLDHTKVPGSAASPAAGGDLYYGDIDEMPRRPTISSSVVVAEVNDIASQAMSIEDGQMESEIVGPDHALAIAEDEGGELPEDISEDDGEFADEDSCEMGVTQRQLSDVDVHPSESVDELMSMQSQLSNGQEEMEAGTAQTDACMVQPSTENNGYSEVSGEIEAPQSEVEAGAGDLNMEEQELPAWYRIFDLNVVETPEACETSEISGDRPAAHVSDSAPDLVGQMNYDLNNKADEHAHEEGQDNQPLEDGYDLNKYDLNNEAEEHARDNHLLSNEDGVAVHGSDNYPLSNEQMLLKQTADELEQDNHQMENEQMLINHGTAEQVLDTYNLNAEQLMLSHGVDEHLVDTRQMEPESTLLPRGVHDFRSYDLNSEQMLVNNGADKHADQVADGQTRVLSMGSGRKIPVINLEDDYEEQSDTREFLESKNDILHKYKDSILQEHASSQDQTSSFPDSPQANIQATLSSSVTPNFGNRCTGNSQL